LKNCGIHAWLVICLVLALASCDPGRLYEVNKNVEPSGWHYQNRIPFDVQITDTVKFYNVLVNLRVASDYKYSNIFLWVHTTSPDKQTDKRRIEMKLADERGKWLGNGLGDLYDYQFPVYNRIKFPKSGFYRFEIEQNMREDTLMHIKSTGIRVEEWKQETE
jgi:gliding motility-associated lipoprotein GldH